VIIATKRRSMSETSGYEKCAAAGAAGGRERDLRCGVGGRL
jgi:hypothetical protein